MLNFPSVSVKSACNLRSRWLSHRKGNQTNGGTVNIGQNAAIHITGKVGAPLENANERAVRSLYLLVKFVPNYEEIAETQQDPSKPFC